MNRFDPRVSVIVITVFLLSLIFAMTLSAQVEQKTQLKYKTKLELPMADLIITELEVTQPGSSKGDMIEFSFRAKVKNDGNRDIENNFYLTIEIKSEHEDRYDRTHNYFKFTPLKAGLTRTYNGKFTLQKASVSGKTAKIRGWIDSGGTEEFPPQYMHVQERNENNNYSDIITIVGAYTPYITSVSIDNPVTRLTIRNTKSATNQEIYIAGQGFGKEQGEYDVALFPQSGGSVIKANIKSWHQGVIFFTIPKEVETGTHWIAIVNGNTMQRKSNQIGVTINHKGGTPWSEIVAYWELLNNAKLIIHTRGSGSEYKNTSTLKMLGNIDTIYVPKTEFKKKLIGRYRYLLQNFASKDTGGMMLSRKWNGGTLNDNQLEMKIIFESGGVEAKGYFKSVVKGSNWNDGLAPDIDINNAKIGVIFNFKNVDRKLDYTPYVRFSANVNAHDAAADWFMDLFMGNWDGQVRRKIQDGLATAMANSETRENIINSLMDFLYLLIAGFDKNDDIQNIEFEDGKILFTYR